MLASLLSSILVAASGAPSATAPGVAAVMAWERTQLTTGVSIAGYDVSPDGASIVAAVCRGDGTCLIGLKPSRGNARAYRPPIGESWRQPRFLDERTIILISAPREGDAWSSARSLIVKLDLVTGTARTILDSAFISDLAPVGQTGVCYAQAQGMIDLPLVPGRQNKPVRFTLRCIDGEIDKGVGTAEYDSLENLTVVNGAILTNAAGSRFGGRGPKSVARAPDGAVHNATLSTSLRTGAAQRLVETSQDQLTWLSGVWGATPVIGRMSSNYWKTRATRRQTTLFELGAKGPSKLAVIAGSRPGPLRAGRSTTRGLMLVNDPQKGALAYRFAWLDRASGELSMADDITRALTALCTETSQ